ncbi:MAG: hypothetical protein OXT70_15470 [Chloroflexota bacterium]|nr:hypothetical protein [Chloroflexota bacterium]
MPPPMENPFWPEFRRFLSVFAERLSTDSDLNDEHLATIWSRQGQGSLVLGQETADRYGELLRSAQRALAPHNDLSRATIDKALQDAMFAVAQAKRDNPEQLAERIDLDIDLAKERLEGQPEQHECWIEVHGLDPASLPGQFGSTRLEPFSQSHLDRLDEIDRATNAPIPQASARHMLGADLSYEGRVIAIEQVRARDTKAAIGLATREVTATLDCLNCFSEIIPYNRAILRVATSRRPSGSAIRYAHTVAGAFRNSPKSEIPWEYSMEQLWKLDGFAGKTVCRLDELLRQRERSEVDELLIRAARWIGRASAADTVEYDFLYTAIAIDCMMKPVWSRDKTLLNRLKRLLSDFADIDEIDRLWQLRNDLVHDGQLEVPEIDKRLLHNFALNSLGRLLANDELKGIDSLVDLDKWFEYLVSK